MPRMFLLCWKDTNEKLPQERSQHLLGSNQDKNLIQKIVSKSCSRFVSVFVIFLVKKNKKPYLILITHTTRCFIQKKLNFPYLSLFRMMKILWHWYFNISTQKMLDSILVLLPLLLVKFLAQLNYLWREE